jgi:hypothetical protein
VGAAGGVLAWAWHPLSEPTTPRVKAEISMKLSFVVIYIASWKTIAKEQRERPSGAPHTRNTAACARSTAAAAIQSSPRRPRG